MLIIGVDPGTASTGYGLVRQIQGGELELVDYGVFTTPSDQCMSNRLMKLYDDLTALLAIHRFDSGAVEKLFFQKNVTTAISVGQARGVALLALAQAGIPVNEYTPREIKQAVVGYGGADKTQIQKMVKALLKMETIPRPDDAADALAVAICHLHSSQTRSHLEESL